MGFRVSIRMTKYFTDERSFSYVYVSDKFKKIHHLESHLVDLFGIKRPFCLMNENILLPSSENILILRCDEILSVVPILSSFNFENNATFSLPGTPTKCLEEAEIVEKEAKKKRKKKNKESLPEASEAEFIDDHIPQNPIENLMQTKVIDNPKVYKAIRKIEEYHSKYVKVGDEEDVEAMKSKALNVLKDFFPINGVSDGRIQKRKRIRIRKNKKSSQAEYLQSDSESNLTQNNTSLLLTNGKKNASHIRFSPAVENTVKILQNDIDPQKFDKKPKIVHPIQQDLSHLNASGSIIVSEDNISTSTNHFEKETDKSNNHKYYSNSIECNGSFENTNTTNDLQISPFNVTLKNVLEDLNKYPIQSKMSLKNEDVIVFKILKMGENYEPIISSLILGTVVNCDTDSQSLKLLIREGQQEWSEPSGKFQIDESPGPDSQVPITIFLTWNQLIEPRLIIP